MSMYKVVRQLFETGEDSKLIQDRKSVIMDLTTYGYSQVLVYPKACVKEVRIGSVAIPYGFLVREVIRKPHSLDGYVIATAHAQ